MKKIILPVLALAAALTVSCNKEQEMDAPAAKATHKATIEASIEETKTAYANDKTFSWLEGDKISVMEELNSEVKFDEFTAAATGRATTFDGEISDGATFGQWAVYPSNLNPQVTDGALSITLPRYYMLDVQGEDVANGYLSSDNPMANLPLVGQKQEDGKYKFSTAMGVVKFSFTNVPDDVAYVVLTANEVIAGTFTADENGVFSLNSTDGGNIAFFQVTPTEQHTLDVYFPMPVGTLTAGLKIELADGDLTTLFSRSTVKDIEVVRNRVTEIAALNAMPWRTLGTGKFNDKFTFSFFGKADTFVDVTIEEDTEVSGQYRINSPYSVFFQDESYTPSGSVYGPDSYFIFQVLQEETTISSIQVPAGVVTYDAYYTGYYDTSSKQELILAPVTAFGDDYATLDRFTHSRIIKTQSDGKPANVQLAPIFFGPSSYLSWLTTNGMIQIVFPGCDPLDLNESLSFHSIPASSTATSPKARCYVVVGKDLTAKIGFGTSEAEALAAAKASTTIWSDVNGLSDCPLPDNLPSGTYVAAMQTYLGDEEWSVISDSFDYVNPDAGTFTVDDVVGTYTVIATSYFSGSDSEMELTIAASDDASKGNVMFTNFFDFTASTPIYGTLSETGKLTFDNEQEYYTQGSITLMTATVGVNGSSYSYGTSPGAFQFDSPGVFHASSGNEYIAIASTAGNLYDMFSALSGTRVEDVPIVDDGEVVEGAPAKAPRKVSLNAKGFQISRAADVKVPFKAEPFKGILK